MNLWLLEPIDPDHGPWDPWYDKVFGMVIRARTEEDARILAAKNAGPEKDQYIKNPWLIASLTRCIEISGMGSEGVILTDTRQA